MTAAPEARREPAADRFVIASISTATWLVRR